MQKNYISGWKLDHFMGRGRRSRLPSLTVALLLVLASAGAAEARPFVYVANFNDDSVSVIDGATNAVAKTIAVGQRPAGVAVSPDGAHVYVANNGDDSVSVIDTATHAVLDTIAVGDGPNAVAVSPDGL